MKIIYFANIRSIIGKNNDEVFLEKPVNISDLIKILKKKNKKYEEAFKNIENIKCSVNYELFNFNKVVNNEDEVAFFPPVTGG